MNQLIPRSFARLPPVAALFGVATAWCVAAAADEVKVTPAPYSAPSQASTVVCKKERSLGSMIPRTVCRSTDQVTRDQKQSRKFLESLHDNQSGQVSSDHPGPWQGAPAP